MTKRVEIQETSKILSWARAQAGFTLSQAAARAKIRDLKTTNISATCGNRNELVTSDLLPKGSPAMMLVNKKKERFVALKRLPKDYGYSLLRSTNPYSSQETVRV
ncbi:unnamed protein product [marine sediment metagenome]|uniref:Uncharacterized protein n=1 Tax=marine sediment metagenome TaxID=412755 RepID=X1QF50_9ZZZZ